MRRQQAGPIEGPRASPCPPFWNQELIVYLIGLLVASHHAHCLYEGVAGVVHSSLDALVQGVAAGRRLVAELGVDGGGEALSHAVVVLAKVRVVCTVYQGDRLSVSRP